MIFGFFALNYGDVCEVMPLLNLLFDLFTFGKRDGYDVKLKISVFISVHDTILWLYLCGKNDAIIS